MPKSLPLTSRLMMLFNTMTPKNKSNVDLFLCEVHISTCLCIPPYYTPQYYTRRTTVMKHLLLQVLCVLSLSQI